MDVKNADGSNCYIIAVQKDIRMKIDKQPGLVSASTNKERS
ncbi:MAG: hypothetical protein GX202_05750 [Firmicutes bacterium]|nr:hypothetical protein [Bacillota bacterium]